MKRIIVLLSVLLLQTINLNAQCDFNSLSDSIKNQVNVDEELLEVFKVYLDRSNKKESLPVAKFAVSFEKETTYRVRIISDLENYKGCGIMQLVEGYVLKGTNYSMKLKKCLESFDFNNPFTRDGELIIYFEDGKEGCAVATISKVKSN